MSKKIILVSVIVVGGIVTATIDRLIGVKFDSIPAEMIHKIIYMLQGAALAYVVMR